ncbi:MAG: hypothetical protein Q7T15_09285 [Microcella sp.]|uniref:hypothetical protein n=1 Tax=Microcella sp. TaxID=1913979 RepID=UPI0027200C9D|nr:hypothetical protein [Microcella sp.]MDO8338430.1 hypothetical protein [Microcella sp.]
MDIPEKGRLAAHVLLDAVSVAHEETGTTETHAVDVAYRRLAEIDAFSVTVRDDGDELDVAVNLSDLLGASLVTLSWLVEQLANERDSTREDILIELRERLDD